jgi:hypothetical protein
METVVGKNTKGQDVTVVVRKPKPKDKIDAKIHEAAAFKKAIDKGAMLRVNLDSYLTKSGVWDDEKRKTSEDLRNKILEGEAQLKRGAKKKDGSVFTKIEARKLALDMMGWRDQYIRERSVFTQNDEYTAESIADKEHFNYLCSACVFNEDGSKHFATPSEYVEKEDEPYVEMAAAELAKIINNYDEKWRSKLPEIAWLIKYKMMDEDYNLINETGQKVDVEGNLIDSNYNKLVDGKPVNEFGDELDADGNIVGYVEFE